jgi:hypothetical protein
MQESKAQAIVVIESIELTCFTLTMLEANVGSVDDILSSSHVHVVQGCCGIEFGLFK